MYLTLIYIAYILNLYIVYIKNIQYIFIVFNMYLFTSHFISYLELQPDVMFKGTYKRFDALLFKGCGKKVTCVYM